MYLEFFFLLGLLGVASNPSPYYAALGLVGGAGAGCLLLVKGGVSFLSLVLFLVYLGGMMVVFAYCAALAAESYPEAWGDVVGVYLGVYLVLGGWALWGGVLWEITCWGKKVEAVEVDWWGVMGILNSGGWTVFFAGWCLMLTLFGVLEVVGGHKGSVLRAV